ncbi:hypothetical protein ACFW2D_07165 [Streptomyces sp. NPDC058914]|jgi:hypothetical protein|uniref:hypothetical protein n=1 Tax=Streptomyces TaxID=1883 RepID=UPI0036AB65EB
MSGNSYYYGDNVNIHGGRGHQGIVKTQIGAGTDPSLSPAVVAAIAELHRMIQDLRTQVPAHSVQLIDESLPALTADAGVPAQERHRALMAVAGIAATVGAVGQPVAQAVQAIMGMLGG